MNSVTVDRERIAEKLAAFARFGGTAEGLTRFALSPEDLAARREFVRRMADLGVETVTDDLANMYATLPGEAGLKRIVLASHLDSVRNGGNFDGVYGVVVAMEVLETVARNRIPHRHPLTAMVWTNEEGSFYPPAMMASGVVCGKFDKEAMLASAGPDGVTFGQALAASGLAGSAANRLNARDYCAMFEAHIEQGPALENAGLEIGIVEGVPGMFNRRVICEGQAEHAGTTPMALRKDALYAAALALEYLHREFDALAAGPLANGLLYTTGEFELRPNIHTIIPSRAEFSLDARHKDRAALEAALRVVETMPATFACCAVTSRPAWERETVWFDRRLVGFVERGAAELGYSAARMWSGAGHDAQYAADLLPTAMIFVPSAGGHSHCRDEYTSPEDAWRGANVALHAALAADDEL